MPSNTVLPSYTVGYDRQTHKTKFGLSTDIEWEELPQVGMPEAPMDGGAYLAVGQEWVKINEKSSQVEVLWHRPKITPGQKVLTLIAGVPMEPYTVKGSYLRNEG